MRARCPRSRETSPPPSSGTCLVGPRRSLVGSAVFLRLEMQYRTGDPCECLVASRPVIDEVADGKQAVPAQVAVERCERVFHGAEAPVDVPDHKVSSEGILCDFDDGGGFVHVVSRLRLRVRPLVRTECRFGKPAGWPAITSSHVGLRGPRACFSNFIEGTEFAIDEAVDIVFRGAVPSERPADAHDILGTWRIVSDSREMGRIPADAATLEALLKGRHATVMEGRPDARPGAFKQEANQAGPTVFVAPDLVTGTLAQGLGLCRSLETPFQRAVFMMFLIAEVHPFADGNGRTARIMMNAELAAAGEERIIVPTVYRANYLSALKALSQTGRPEPIIRMLDHAQRWTAPVDWRSLEATRRELVHCNAFVDPDVAEVEGRRLRMPGSAVA